MFSLNALSKKVDADALAQVQQFFRFALVNFDSEYFNRHTVIVLPNGKYFPDKATNPQQLLDQVFARVCQYAGLAHWPFQLRDIRYENLELPPLLGLPNTRGKGSTAVLASASYLSVGYEPVMIKQAMDLVASFAKSIAQHYLHQSQIPLPQSVHNFNVAAELLSIFMGFGVMIANSAYSFRGGCARCYDPRAVRQASLTEEEALIALAYMLRLKKEEIKSVKLSLKSHLYSRLKQIDWHLERVEKTKLVV